MLIGLVEVAYKFHRGLLVLYQVWRILVVSVDLGYCYNLFLLCHFKIVCAGFLFLSFSFFLKKRIVCL